MAGPVPPVAVRPSGWWYVLPAAAVVVAAVLGIEILRDGWRDARTVVLRANVVSPGEEQLLAIDDPGGYTIGLVSTQPIDGEDDKERLAEDLAIEIEPEEGGAPLPLARYEGFQSLSGGGDGSRYVPLRTVHFEDPGTYVLTSRRHPGLDPARNILVVTQSPYRKIVEAVRNAVLLQVVVVFLAVLGTVILARTRGRSRRALRAAAPPPSPWPGAPPGPGSPWAGPPWPGPPGTGPPGHWGPP